MYDNKIYLNFIANNKIQEAMEYAERHIPDKLCKFYSLSGEDSTDPVVLD